MELKEIQSTIEEITISITKLTDATTRLDTVARSAQKIETSITNLEKLLSEQETRISRTVKQALDLEQVQEDIASVINKLSKIHSYLRTQMFYIAIAIGGGVVLGAWCVKQGIL